MAAPHSPPLPTQAPLGTEGMAPGVRGHAGMGSRGAGSFPPAVLGRGEQRRGCTLQTGRDHMPFLQEPLQLPGVREPGLATISTVAVLERVAGKQPSPWGKEPSAETAGTFPAVPQPYVRQEGPGPRGRAAPEPCQGLGGSRETVQYAQVVGDGYKGQQHAPPRLYLRSNSTQPLLLDPSPSPKPYENLWFHGAPPHGCPGDEGCSEELPATFPLLQGLRIGGAEELHDCRAF